MATKSTVDSLSRLEQFVLLGVARADQEGETPIQTHELRRACRTQFEPTETGIIGSLSEADVMRSLYRLDDGGFVTEVDIGEQSPTGKGRPAYELDIAAETVYEGVDADFPTR